MRVGGANLCDLSLTELREHIGLVPQETALFSSTLRDNIAFGKPDADEATIIAAAKQAQAHEFIMAIDGGYNAYVGEKGCTVIGWTASTHCNRAGNFAESPFASSGRGDKCP